MSKTVVGTTRTDQPADVPREHQAGRHPTSDPLPPGGMRVTFLRLSWPPKKKGKGKTKGWPIDITVIISSYVSE